MVKKKDTLTRFKLLKIKQFVLGYFNDKFWEDLTKIERGVREKTAALSNSLGSYVPGPSQGEGKGHWENTGCGIHSTTWGKEIGFGTAKL